MNEFYNEIILKVNGAISDLENTYDYSLDDLELVIELIFQNLSKMKEHILKNGFKDKDSEVYFFKHQKPILVSKLIYFNAIYKIETKRPFGTKQVVKDYINKELEKLKRFYDNNLDLYKYYRTNSSHLDHKYFVRGKPEIKLGLDTFYFEVDHNISTSHDYKVAKIMATDLIQIYLESQLKIADKSYLKNKSSRLNLKWTGSKTDLIEMIYAFYHQGVFENGNADIKLIAQVFETTFNINLGDYYHTFMELKYRKTSRTKFIDNLRETLIKKMDEQ